MTRCLLILPKNCHLNHSYISGNQIHSVVLSVGDYFVMAQAQPAYVASADNAPAIYSAVTKVK